MDHDELIQELPAIERLSNQVRSRAFGLNCSICIYIWKELYNRLCQFCLENWQFHDLCWRFGEMCESFKCMQQLIMIRVDTRTCRGYWSWKWKMAVISNLSLSTGETQVGPSATSDPAEKVPAVRKGPRVQETQECSLERCKTPRRRETWPKNSLSQQHHVTGGSRPQWCEWRWAKVI